MLVYFDVLLGWKEGRREKREKEREIEREHGVKLTGSPPTRHSNCTNQPAFVPAAGSDPAAMLLQRGLNNSDRVSADDTSSSLCSVQ